jgi:hypothetical protein
MQVLLNRSFDSDTEFRNSSSPSAKIYSRYGQLSRILYSQTSKKYNY